MNANVFFKMRMLIEILFTEAILVKIVYLKIILMQNKYLRLNLFTWNFRPNLRSNILHSFHNTGKGGSCKCTYSEHCGFNTQAFHSIFEFFTSLRHLYSQIKYENTTWHGHQIYFLKNLSKRILKNHNPARISWRQPGTNHSTARIIKKDVADHFSKKWWCNNFQAFFINHSFINWYNYKVSFPEHKN